MLPVADIRVGFVTYQNTKSSHLFPSDCFFPPTDRTVGAENRSFTTMIRVSKPFSYPMISTQKGKDARALIS